MHHEQLADTQKSQPNKKLCCTFLLLKLYLISRQKYLDWNLVVTFASSGPELDTDPDIKCGNFSLTQAAIEPG